MALTLGLIAGSGRLPFEVAGAAAAQGVTLAIVAIEGNTDPAIEGLADGDFTWLAAGELGKLIEFFKTAKADEVILAGAVAKREMLLDPAALRPDARAIALLTRLTDRGDDAILRGVAEELESEGLPVVSSTQHLGERLTAVGLLAGPQPSAVVSSDLELGLRVARQLGQVDVGQSVVVREGTVVAVEALEGTDSMLRRAATLVGPGSVLVKSAKPAQDLRFDVPAVGPQTIALASEGGFAAIGLEAGRDSGAGPRAGVPGGGGGRALAGRAPAGVRMSLPSVAVVGVGHMGQLHAQKLAQLQQEGEIRFAGICDADPSARQVAEPLNCAIFEGLPQLIDQADAACIAVPTVLHGEIAGKLLEAGIDVLVEKPMATSLEAARRLIELADSTQRILQVGHLERFSRAFQEVRPVITRPRFIEVHRIGPYPGRATDAGVVLDLMIHDLDLIAQLAGLEIAAVEGIGIPVLSSTEDIANARVRFVSGCVANLTASRVSVERMRKIRVFQPDAYLSIDFMTNQISVIRREGEPGGELSINAQQLEFDSGDALLAQDRAFARAVRSRDKPEVGGSDGYRALELALRIIDSFPAFEELV